MGRARAGRAERVGEGAVLGFQELAFAGGLGGGEVAPGAGHPVLALLEEGVGAVPVPEVVVLPWLTVRSGGRSSRRRCRPWPAWSV
jgi:hypothetical protein